MFLVGPLVNTVAILAGSLIGLFFNRMPDEIKSAVMNGLALFVCTLGISMALPGAGVDSIYLVAALVFGGILGAVLGIERRLSRFGEWVEHRMGRSGGGVAQAFVFSSLVFGVGSMAILGALQSGLNGQNTILFTKSALDGFSALLFSSTMGPGVALSAVPIFLYEGGIATLAHYFGANFSSPPILEIVTATGGLLILGLGVNMLLQKKIPVANLLPAMLVAALLKWIGLHAVIGNPFPG